MLVISTKLHGAADYATGLLMLAAPRLLPIRDRRAQALVSGTGGGVLLIGSITDYEFGLRRKLPMSAHLLLDAVTGGLLIAGAMAVHDRRAARVPDWLPAALLGAGEIAAAALTQRQPGDRAGAGTAPPEGDTSLTGEGAAGQPPAGPLATPIAPAPIETPGPSVTPPRQPESDVERADRLDSSLSGAGAPQTGDTLVAQQEAAAGAEAAAIGGTVPASGDPAMDPLLQAGGGEQDGWEAADADLIENATHGDGHGQPERDAIAPEAESDRTGAVYGEADHTRSSELVDDESNPRDERRQQG